MTRPVLEFRRSYTMFFSKTFSYTILFVGLTFLSPNNSFSKDYPKNFTDDLGRAVIIKAKPQRIVSLAPHITEILFELGLGDEIVGVTDFSNYPLKETATVEKVGSYVLPNLEKIISLNPDLVIATADGNPKDKVEKIASLGISVYVISPKTIEDIAGNLKKLGLVTGKKEEGEKSSKKFLEDYGKIKESIEGNARLKVFFQLGTTALYTVNEDTFIDKLINDAGGVNIAAGEPIRYPAFSIEAILKEDPDVIIISLMHFDDNSANDFWQRYPTLKAVKNNDICRVNPDITNRPSHRILLGLKAIRQCITGENRLDLSTGGEGVK